MSGRFSVSPLYRGGRKYWAVFNREGEQVSGAVYTEDEARERMNQLIAAEQRKYRRSKRRCMCCEKEFMSEGSHNRLCNICGRGGPNTNWRD